MDKERLGESFYKGTITDETLMKANAILVIKCANLEHQIKKQKEVIYRLIELNQTINNSDYVYSQDEITTKNLDILKEVSE